MTLLHDLRLGLRALRRRPVYTLVSVLVLALGLAVSSTAFTFVNTFYQEIPGSEAGDRLVSIVFVDTEGRKHWGASYLDFPEYAAATDVLDGLAGVASVLWGGVLEQEDADGTSSEWVWGRAVTANFFSVLGVEMSAGRSFSAAADDDAMECVLSYPFWQHHFGGDPAIVGETVTIDRQEILVVGVAAQKYRTIFEGFHPNMWLSLGSLSVLDDAWTARKKDRDRQAFGFLGRLRPGVSYEQAAARLAAVDEALRSAHRADEAPRRALVTRKLRLVDYMREDYRGTHLAMLGAAGALLLLACANVANVLFTVALGRGRELAIRAALGAGPGRLLRLLLTENLLLAVLAGGAGMLLTAPASAAIIRMWFVGPDPGSASLLTFGAAPELTLDLRFYAVSVLLALVAGLGSGLLPAWRSARRDLVTALKDSGEAPATGLLHRLVRLSGRELLVAFQVALSVALVVGAALLWRTFNHVAELEPGFDHENLLTSLVSLRHREMTPEERLLYLDRLTEHLAAQPGVLSAAVSRRIPFATGLAGQLLVESREEPVRVMFAPVGPGFVETLKLPLLRGRLLDGRDTADAAGAVVVNDEFVQRYSPAQDPLGRRVELPATEAAPEGGDQREFEIVGVVGAYSFGRIWEAQPAVYFSLDQRGHTPSPRGFSNGFGLVVRTTKPPAWLYGALRDFDPALAVMNVVPMASLVSVVPFDQQANAWYFSVLALLGLALAAAGLWSVLNLAVRQRFREIGIRTSLGARRGDLTRLFLRRGLRAVGLGLCFGLLAALATGKLLESLLYGVGANDAWAFLTGATVLAVVAFVACAVPALRAARVDPLLCLREE